MKYKKMEKKGDVRMFAPKIRNPHGQISPDNSANIRMFVTQIRKDGIIKIPHTLLEYSDFEVGDVVVCYIVKAGYDSETAEYLQDILKEDVE